MLRNRIRDAIDSAVKQAQAEGTMPSLEVPLFSVEVPEQASHGDYATNAALVIGKLAGTKPMDVANLLAEKLKKAHPEMLADVRAAKPGFVNLFLSDAYLAAVFTEALNPEAMRRSWSGKKVILEFTDPNPFKEFHIGHLYSNIVGESLSRIFQASGADVRRANYQGDVGLHVAKAVWGMQQMMGEERVDLTALKEKSFEERIRFMAEAYQRGDKAYGEDELAKQGMSALNKKIFELDESVKDIYEQGRGWSLEYFERIYKRLGTKFDFYYFERDVGKTGLALVRENIGRVFEESEGAIIFDGEKHGLHRRVFITTAGLPTYEAKELGLAPTKYRDFKYDVSVIVTGSEIIDYFKVLLAALKEIYPELGEKIVHVAHGMVRLAHGKMSSRSGDVIRAQDLLDEMKARVLALMESLENTLPASKKQEVAEQVAVGAAKYSLLRVGIGKDIAFDMDTSLSLEGDSGPYLQYTHARLKSIIRKIAEQYKSEHESLHINSISPDELEHSLLVQIARLPEVLADARESFQPNVVANYLYHLAKLANEFYHSHPVSQEADGQKRNFRIGLVKGMSEAIASGLWLLGIQAPEEM